MSKETKYIWVPSGDGTVIYVKEVWKNVFGLTRQRELACFYASERHGERTTYENAVKTARKYIKRLKRTEIDDKRLMEEYLDLLHDYKHAVNMGYDDEVKQYQYAMDQLVEMMYKSDEKD